MPTHLAGRALLVSLFAVGGAAQAATVAAATCSKADVQGAIASAASGDTVVVPSGSCTWAGVSIPGSKALTLAGGNGGVTTIAGSAALQVAAHLTATSRVTGFTFVGAGTSNDGDVRVDSSPGAAAVRVDHNAFANSAQCTFITVGGNGPALIDHNTFTGGGASEIIHNVGLGPGDPSGWTDDIIPGGPAMVFIEDNTFDNSDTTYLYSAVQSYYGARTVVRHNVLNFSQVDQHGTAGMTGARWYEVYENTFQPNSLNQCCYGAFRAGSGVLFDNHVVGSPQWQPGSFDFYEEDTGTWPLAFQVGSGINGQTNQHATCAGGARNSSPVYLWGNDAAISIGSQTSSKVVEGRDYFVSATQPATLFRQQLAADTCSTTYNYVPYAYPHPLQAVDGGGSPVDGGSDGGGGGDAGVSDAGAGDAGEADGGAGDAGASDAGAGDAGAGDAGAGDAGAGDAGAADAGAGDAGTGDAGAADAGASDAGAGVGGVGGGCGCGTAGASLLVFSALGGLLVAGRRQRVRRSSEG